MSRSWPIGLAILSLIGAIANYEEQRTEESLTALRHARFRASRRLTPFRNSKVRHIFAIDYLKSLNLEIEKARQLIWEKK